MIKLENKKPDTERKIKVEAKPAEVNEDSKSDDEKDSEKKAPVEDEEN